MSSIKTFEDLACYREAREFLKLISRFCRTLPKEGVCRLKDQIIRASRSVTANIAEGFGRHHHQENAQFCGQARGSLFECLEHLNVALDEGYMDDGEHKRLRLKVEEVLKILNGYIAYIQRCAKAGVPKPAGPAGSPHNSTTQGPNNS